jgi:hypothetical protein
MSRALRAVSVTVVLLLVLAGCNSNQNSAAPPKQTPQPTSTATAPAPAPTYTAPPPVLPVPGSTVALTTAPPPWPAPAVVGNGAGSAAYVAAAGLPYAEEMLSVHYHAHLDILVDGKTVEVPPYLGFVATGQKVLGLAPLHTHDGTGVIHIENSVPAEFVLGQVFVEWGVRFTPTCLAGYCTDSGHELAVFVNGKRTTSDPTRIVLTKHEEIAIEYGPTGKLPSPPSSYHFPNGL